LGRPLPALLLVASLSGSGCSFLLSPNDFMVYPDAKEPPGLDATGMDVQVADHGVVHHDGGPPDEGSMDVLTGMDAPDMDAPPGDAPPDMDAPAGLDAPGMDALPEDKGVAMDALPVDTGTSTVTDSGMTDTGTTAGAG
jgi:hypothetical protein